jgi:acetyl-CoA carboxylase carboxyltransferase component
MAAPWRSAGNRPQGNSPMNWQSELDELRRRERMAHAMGGPDKVERQPDGARITVRERIDGLVHPGRLPALETPAG